MPKPLLIEVGAFDGHDSLRWHAKGYKVLTFEPKRDLYEKLSLKTSGLSDYEVVNKAISLIDGIVKFNICKSGGASSLLEFKCEEELIKHWGSGRTDVHFSGESYHVESTTLKKAIEERNLQMETIAFLHVDAQGVDLDVLKSLGPYIKNVKEGVIECAISAEKAIYKEQSSIMGDCKDWLTSNGFSVLNVTPNDHGCEYNISFRSKTL